MPKTHIDQPIYCLTIDDAQRIDSQVFIDGNVTGIKPYRDEDGSLWFTVWVGSEITKRINGRFVVQVDFFTQSGS